MIVQIALIVMQPSPATNNLIGAARLHSKIRIPRLQMVVMVGSVSWPAFWSTLQLGESSLYESYRSFGAHVNILTTYVQSYGVYLSEYLDTNRYPGASQLDFALVGGFNFAFAMIVAPLVTAMTRHFGKHITMPIGIILQSVGYITAGFTTEVWQLFLSQGIAVGIGIGFIYIPSLPILSQWFESRRSLANGISSAGSGFGGALFAWATGSIIEAFSVGTALWATGILTFILTGIATCLIRDRNKYIKPPQLAFDIQLLKRYDVRMLLLWAFITMFGYITLLFSLSDFALATGFSKQQATNIIGILNIGTAFGRPVIGIASDKSSRLDVAGVLTLVCGLSCFAFWIPAQSYALLVFFTLLSGAILGVFWMVSELSLPAMRVANAI